VALHFQSAGLLNTPRNVKGMTLCRLEVGDTADWSLRYDGAAAALNRYPGGEGRGEEAVFSVPTVIGERQC